MGQSEKEKQEVQSKSEAAILQSLSEIDQRHLSLITTSSIKASWRSRAHNGFSRVRVFWGGKSWFRTALQIARCCLLSLKVSRLWMTLVGTTFLLQVSRSLHPSAISWQNGRMAAGRERTCETAHRHEFQWLTLSLTLWHPDRLRWDCWKLCV